MGHLCNKFGLTEMHSSSGRHVSNTVQETSLSPTHFPLPTATYGTQSFANPLSPSKNPQILPLVSPILHDTPEMEKWRSAQDMFTQYDISRPPGWLSDIEDLSLSGDGNASPRRYCRYCHICSTATWAPTTAPPVGTVFAKGARVRYPVALRRLMPTFRAMKAPIITRDGSRYVSAPRSNLESTQKFRQQGGTVYSTPNSRHKDRIETQQGQSSKHRADPSRRNRNDGHGEETTLPEKSTPVMRDGPHMR